MKHAVALRRRRLRRRPFAFRRFVFVGDILQKSICKKNSRVLFATRDRKLAVQNWALSPTLGAPPLHSPWLGDTALDLMGTYARTAPPVCLV
jgi:hypothetical protein